MLRRILSCLVVLLGVLLLAAPPMVQGQQSDEVKALHQRAKELAEAQKIVEAEKAYLVALQEYHQVGPKQNNVGLYLQWCMCRNELGSLQTQMYKFAEARVLFEQTLPFLKQLAALHAKEPAFRFELAKTQNLLSVCHHEAELMVEAEAQRKEGVALLTKLVEEHPSQVEYRKELAKFLSWQGAELRLMARYPEAEAAYQGSIRVARQLVQDFPKVPEHGLSLAEAYNAYALLVRESGRFAPAAEMIREAIRILKQHEADYPDRPEYWRSLPTLYRNLAQPLHFLNNDAEEKSAQREALRVETKLARLPDSAKKWLTDEAKVLGSLQNQDLVRLSNQQAEVDAVFAKAEKLAKDHPDVPIFQGKLASAKSILAMRLMTQYSVDEAQRHLQDALQLCDKVVARYPGIPKHRHVLADICYLNGIALLVAGQRAEGEKHVQKGIALLEKLADDYPAVPKLRFAQSEAMLRTVMHLKSKGEVREAAVQLVAAHKVMQKLSDDFPTCPEYRRHFAQTYITLGNMHLGVKENAEAEKCFRAGIVQWTKVAADFPANSEFRLALGHAHAQLGHYFAQAGKFQEAEEAYRAVIRLHQALILENPREAVFHQALAGDDSWIGTMQEKQERLPDAVDSLSKSIASLETTWRMNPRQRDVIGYLKAAHKQRAFMCLKLGRSADYQNDLERAKDFDEMLDSPLVRLIRVNHRLKEGKQPLALKEAEDLFLNADLTEAQYHDLAEFYAQAADGATSAQQKELLAARAVAALRKARELGHVSLVSHTDNPQFRNLAGRADFRKLVGERQK